MEKNLIFFVSLLAFTFAYTDLDDTFDADGVTRNGTELKRYVDCFIDKGPCPEDLMLHKNHVLEAVTDGCRECTEIQKHNLRALFKGIKALLPEQLEDFKAKYDPDGSHIAADEIILEKY